MLPKVAAAKSSSWPSTNGSSGSGLNHFTPTYTMFQQQTLTVERDAQSYANSFESRHHYCFTTTMDIHHIVHVHHNYTSTHSPGSEHGEESSMISFTSFVCKRGKQWISILTSYQTNKKMVQNIQHQKGITYQLTVFQPTNLDMTLAFRASSDIGHCPPRESSSQLL